MRTYTFIEVYSAYREKEGGYKKITGIGFNIASELGSLLLHYKVELNMQDRKSYRTLEDEVHSFASEFLLP